MLVSTISWRSFARIVSVCISNGSERYVVFQVKAAELATTVQRCLNTSLETSFCVSQTNETKTHGRPSWDTPRRLPPIHSGWHQHTAS